MRLRTAYHAVVKSKLSAGYTALAIQLQETANNLTSSDIRARLADACRDHCEGTGCYCYCIDYIGDAESGDAICCMDGDTFKVPYEISGTAGAAKCVMNWDEAVDVVPRTVYEEEQDEADHYAAMEESYKRDGLYSGLPLYERFISKSERDDASSDDFAGKGRSFPILKPSDIMAAVHSMGRAGSSNLGPSGIKSRIIAIAKRKGWTKYLPKAWQSDGGEAKESKPAAAAGSLRLSESYTYAEPIALSEAFAADKLIKLISPGRGSTAFYTEEVLKRDGPSVFRAGLPMRIDHPTKREEAERPEGSVKDWGAVLREGARWLDSYIGKSGKDYGPGLYAPIKPFSDHATTIDEKGPYAGVSIAAWGEPVTENGKPVLREGVPLLASLTSADGADMVTRAGRGGMFVSEAATAAIPQQENNGMDAAALTKLQETANRLQERVVLSEARDEAGRILKTTSLAESVRNLIVDTVCADITRVPRDANGELDKAKLTEAVNREAVRVAEAFTAAIPQGVRGFGPSMPAQETDPARIAAREAEARRSAEALKLEEAEAVQTYIDLGMTEAQAKFAAKGRAA